MNELGVLQRLDEISNHRFISLKVLLLSGLSHRLRASRNIGLQLSTTQGFNTVKEVADTTSEFRSKIFKINYYPLIYHL